MRKLEYLNKVKDCSHFGKQALHLLKPEPEAESDNDEKYKPQFEEVEMKPKIMTEKKLVDMMLMKNLDYHEMQRELKAFWAH